MNFAIIGGDLRSIKLAQMLTKEDKVHTYGLEKADELKEKENIFFYNQINEAIEASEIIIGPMPLSKNGEEINAKYSDKIIKIKDLIYYSKGKTLIAGAISKNIYEIEKNIKIIDIMEREELAILNAISTAEGTIEVMMTNTQKIIHGAEVLILGFGRIAKVLAKKLEGLSAKVTCAARKKEDIAWIEAYSYEAKNINNLGEEIKKYDIIINTVPHMILTKEKLEFVKKDTLLIDLASAPGGIDRNAVEEKKLNFIWALALPGKVAPITSAEIIKNIIYSYIREERKECD